MKTKQLKVVTVVGTRPEIIRLSCVIKSLDDSASINHILIHTGQNYDYELNQIFFDDLGLRKPNYFLDAAGGSATETIGNILIKIDPLLGLIQPDAFLVLGDTNSCLCAIPAKKRRIPVFHMEAGNRCFDQRVPEETNRKIVDHIADINLTYSDIAREYLLREGLNPDRVIKTGSPMFEVLMSHAKNIKSSNVLEKLGLEKNKYFIVSAHREENIESDRSFNKLVNVLEMVASEYNYPIIVSVHPRTRKKIESKGVTFNSNIQLLKPLGFVEYNALQANSFFVLSDSGTISEESSILGFRALNIRETHERPEAMEESSVVMTGLNIVRVLQAIQHITNQSENKMQLVADYAKPNVSEKVVRIILSYTDYVKRVVWGEHL
jgi:UDP-N-acetylglucosamine 2-epimerase